ncbi:MAG TPA: Wzz/FepE/Etk N-terminal domain-containing protein [Bryobacteraceae bacterium]|nr:Wzz/FepE/Etk N-terminal domain-containing protein [Bryobacteraceae bacterium]
MTRDKNRLIPGQFHPMSLLRMLWKHRMLITITTLAISIAGLIVIYAMPDIYQADAVIVVDSQKIPEKFVASTVEVTLRDSLNEISHRVLNSSQLQQIIDDLGLYPKERKKKSREEILDQMRNHDLTITLERGFGGVRPGGGAFRVTYEGPSPVTVAKVVNRIADLFIRENFRDRAERAAGTSEFLEQRLDEAQKSLDQQEAMLSQYKMRYSGELPQQEPELLGALNRLHSELIANEEAITRAQQNRLLLQNTLQFAETDEAGTERALAEAEKAAKLQATTKEAAAPKPQPKPSEVVRAQLEAAQLRYTDDHPEVKLLKAELARLEQEESIAAQQAATSDVAKPIPSPTAIHPTVADLNRAKERIATVRTQLALMDADIVKRNNDRDRITKEIADYQGRVESLPKREQQMAGLTRDYENSKTNYHSLLEKKMSAEMATQMERGKQSERFAVTDPARVPVKPVKPKRKTLSTVLVIAALGLSLGLTFLIELRKGVVLGEWELPEQMVVLGKIPRIVLTGPEIRVADRAV